MKSSKKTRQITVLVGLVVKDGNILLVQRHEPEVKDAHMKWEYPGGKVGFDETPEEAVVREIREETGVITKVKRLLPVSFTSYWNYPWGVQQTLLFGFECEYVFEEERKEDHHVHTTKWVPIEDLKDYDMLSGGKEFLEALRR